jgi:hypothetical protein
MKNKFGSKEFFLDYMKNQVEKEEAPKLEVIHRIHFSMTHFIFENFKGKQAIGYIRNLTEAGEEMTDWKKVSYL